MCVEFVSLKMLIERTTRCFTMLTFTSTGYFSLTKEDEAALKNANAGPCIFCGNLTANKTYEYNLDSREQMSYYVCIACTFALNGNKGLMTELDDLYQWVFGEDLE